MMWTSANAATIRVTKTKDSGAGSLRAALAGAADGDSIHFAISVPATIRLTSGELLVTNSMDIIGPGLGNLAINGNAASRVFHIGSNTVVSISSLIITNGAATGSVFPDCCAAGIYNDHATLTVSNCTVSGNSAIIAGGGIVNDGSPFLRVCPAWARCAKSLAASFIV